VFWQAGKSTGPRRKIKLCAGYRVAKIRLSNERAGLIDSGKKRNASAAMGWVRMNNCWRSLRAGISISFTTRAGGKVGGIGETLPGTSKGKDRRKL